VFLGAGFSSAAGLPVASALFGGSVPVTRSKARKSFAALLTKWKEWRHNHPSGSAEEWLDHLYRSDQSEFTLALAFIRARLAGLDPLTENRRGTAWYREGITRRTRCTAHLDFWRALSGLRLKGVVTTNYDILAEQSLRDCSLRRGAPNCYYGGFPRPQFVKRKRNVVGKITEIIELTGSIPLLKIHGSLNWSLRNGEIQIDEDLGAAIRRLEPSALVPPLSGKSRPDWLEPVWRRAREVMAGADVWIICGYAAQAYDRQVSTDLLMTAAETRNRKIVYVSDLEPGTVVGRLRRFLPRQFEFVALPGLPDVTHELGNIADDAKRRLGALGAKGAV
jgi:hypothetical protein